METKSKVENRIRQTFRNSRSHKVNHLSTDIRELS